MNLARYNPKSHSSNPGFSLGAPASGRQAVRFLTAPFAGGTPALPDVVLRLRTIAAFVILLTAVWPAAAQTTNTPAAANFSAFQIIVDRNIFNPNRYAHTRGHSHSTSPSAPWFSLVGTLGSKQGMLAFFNGNDSDYRKVVSPDGVIAGYKVTEITLQGVKLISTNKPVVMRVGAQMRQEDKGGWQLTEPTELSTVTAAGEAPATEETSASGPASGSAGESNDILKKLMQQREQELK